MSPRVKQVISKLVHFRNMEFDQNKIHRKCALTCDIDKENEVFSKYTHIFQYLGQGKNPKLRVSSHFHIY